MGFELQLKPHFLSLLPTNVFFFTMFSFPLHATFLSPFHDVPLLFALLFSYSHCCYPFLFVLPLLCSAITLLSSFCCWSPILVTRFFTLLLLLCCYSLKDLVLPPCIPSYKSWKSLRVNNLHFFNKFFFFPHVYCSYVFIYLFLVCGARLVMNCFGNKHKPFEKSW